MNLAILLLPSLLGLLILPWIRNRTAASRVSAMLSGLTLLLTLILSPAALHANTPLISARGWFILDRFNLWFVLINALIGFTTACYAIRHLRNESTLMHRQTYRFYHSAFQLLNLSMLLVLLSNNLGLLWVAMELATVASVILAGLYQTPQALEAAWKYLILCGVGLGLALIGTIIIYFAAHTVLPSSTGLQWSTLMTVAPQLPPQLLEIAFVFVVVGFGVKAGFFPMHNWLPDVYAEAPSVVTALISGVLLNAPFFAILRYLQLLNGTAAGPFAHHILLLFGFGNLLFAALALLRQRTLKRLFAYSSIEHIGLVSIAFGIGTPLACYAGMLHLLLHSLSKSAVFFSVGHITQRWQTVVMRNIRGLQSVQPLSAWLLVAATAAILGLPPFGLFITEILIVWAVLASYPLLAIPLVLGLATAFIAIVSKMQAMVFSKPADNPPSEPASACYWPIILQLTLVAACGLYWPIVWLQPAITLFLQGGG